MMDFLLETWVSTLIERAKMQWMLGGGQRWKSGRPLKLLFAGYNGTRNTGSDVRVEEMLRQVRHVLGAERCELTVMSQNFERTKGYFAGTQQVHLPDIFPPFLYREVRKHHGVVACEGSMFKSKFANALTTMMIGSLGIAAAENKVSIGYGAEAGAMDPMLQKMCRRYLRQSLVITRNEESQTLLSGLGVPTELGTDTAWTFEPHPPEYGRAALQKMGWDGQAPVLVVCPINPYWWPVKASVGKYLARATTGAFKESHYRSVYFHTAGSQVDATYKKYLTAMGNAVDAFRQRHRCFLLLVATERLDGDACQRIAAQLGGPAVATSDDYDMYELVSLLRCATWMVSSRYHGIVTSMPGLVASAGVTMDERIRNLMREREQPELLLTVDDPELEPKLLDVMERLRSERDAIIAGIGRTVVKNLKLMARMGVYLERNVEQVYPEFHGRRGVHGWEVYLPTMSAGLLRLVEEFEIATETQRGR